MLVPGYEGVLVPGYDIIEGYTFGERLSVVSSKYEGMKGTRVRGYAGEGGYAGYEGTQGTRV